MMDRKEAGMISTVLGPMSAEKMGITLVHEHFTFAYPGWFADVSIVPDDFQAALKTNISVIETAQKYGIKTIIDATPNDTGGRNPELYKVLAEKTGLNIICSTGLYWEEEGSPAYWKKRMGLGTDISKMIADLFIKEITEGIGKTGVKAGVIKVGTSPKMSPYEEAVHLAAVKAQQATGVPIITHTEGPTGGIEQADFLIKEGADPKKVMIGHVSGSHDIEYHKTILARGVYIAFDRIGLDIVAPTPVTVKIIADLCKLGYSNKITLSHDTVNVWLGRPYDLPEAILPGFANWRIDFISEKVLPALNAQGVTDEQIKTIMVGNPRNMFLGQ
jgi:phosphotriesterase-related protein